MLMVATVFSLVDRQVLSLLVEPMRSALALSDVEIAVLQGPAFMVSYTLLGFPLGWLVDRVHRVRLVAAGVALWSVACAACGFMDSFETLAIARMFVGVGEAVLGPAIVSLVADYFPPASRPLAMSVQASASSAGVGLAMLAGGTVIAMARSEPQIALAGLAPMDTWRFVFIACGLPGIALALLLLLVREPPRQVHSRSTTASQPMWPFLRAAKHWAIGHFAAISAIAVVGYAFMGWAPTLLVRRHGWPITESAMLLGTYFAVLGPAGSIFAGWLTRRQREHGKMDAALRVCRLSGVGLTLSLGAFALDPTAPVATILLAVAVFCIAMAPGISVAALQEVTPSSLRGRMAAGYYITTNLVGASLGPVIAAALTQYVFMDPQLIGASLATVALVGGPLTVVLLTLTLRPFRDLVHANVHPAPRAN